MRTVLATILVLVISFNVNAQRLVKNEVDEFTGTTIKATNTQSLKTNMIGLGIGIYFKRVDDRISVWLPFTTSSITNVSEGSTVWIKTTDSIYRFTNLRTSVASYRVSQGSTIWSNTVRLEMTPELKNILFFANIVAIRIENNKQDNPYLDFKMPKKMERKKASIREMIQLVES